MLRQLIVWILRLPFILSGVVIVALFMPRIFTGLYTHPRTYKVDDAPHTPVAIIFGAGLRRDGSPSPILRERVNKGVELYFSGKVAKLLMSGDNRSVFYDEPGAMRDFALDLGVPEQDIVVDYAGLRTYDTCYRARHIFEIRQAILVTQNFHLPRAVYTCNALGINAAGVAAERTSYRPVSLLYWNLRETLATMQAFLDVHITHPAPILGSPQPIFPPEI